MILIKQENCFLLLQDWILVLYACTISGTEVHIVFLQSSPCSFLFNPTIYHN